MSIRFDIVTLFPAIFDGFLTESLLNKAIERKLIEVHRWNIRDWTLDRHNKVDDRPYGGGPGMVIAPQPVFDCIEAVQGMGEEPGLLVSLTPQGWRLNHELVEMLAAQRRLILLCGRYEGFDERIRLGLKPLEVSIGDFVCNGGEVPAMVVIETVMRLVPGVLGDEESAKQDSHASPDWVEFEQYTRPPEFRGMKVPEILLSGNHQAIARWRAEQARLRSEQRKQQTKGHENVNDSFATEDSAKQPESGSS